MLAAGVGATLAAGTLLGAAPAVAHPSSPYPGPNRSPVAYDREATTAEDTAVHVRLRGTDVDRDRLRYSVVSGPANGTLTGDGRHRTYTPSANWFGTDTFTYRVSDRSLSDTATVTIVVTPVNDPPVARDQAVVTTRNDDLPITLVGDDVEGSSLTSAIVRRPAHGDLDVLGNGRVLYDPDRRFVGTDSFTFTVSDGTTTSAPATVTITVKERNRRPVAEARTASTTVNTPVSFRLRGSDPEGGRLTYLVTQPASGGTVSLSGRRLATFRPAPGFVGTATFTFRVSDGELSSAPATVSVTVSAATPVATPQSVSVSARGATPITLTSTNTDGAGLTYAIVDGPDRGTVALVGDVATYTPDRYAKGSDSFTFTVTDNGVTSSPATVSITVSGKHGGYPHR